MIRKILLLLAIFILHSCSSSKNSYDKLVGQSKKNLIKSWGTPIRSIDNAEEGEILIYGEQVYANVNNEEGSRMAGTNHWDYTYIYVNKEGKIYSYKKDKQKHTPQEIAVK